MRTSLAFFAFAAASFAPAQSLYSSATVDTLGLGGTNSVSDNSVVGRSDSIGTFFGSANAASDYGILHAMAFGSSVGGSSFAYSQGFSSFGDLLTITGGTGDDYYLMDYLVGGTLSATGAASAHSNLVWDNLPNGQPGGLTTGTYTVAGVYPVKFTYGVAFAISANLFSGVQFTSGGVGEGSADFSHTATLSAIRIVDKNGVSVGPRRVTSASGHVYPQPVPEPASWTALGLGALALLRRRRSAR